MKILKGAGDFVILTPESELRRQVLAIEIAGRTCYQSQKGNVTPKSAGTFIKMLLKRGHESVIEHSCLTVKFVGCSRGFTHELVRHRIASFSQESTRYVDERNTNYIVPPHRDENEKVSLENGQQMSLVEMLEKTEQFYRALRQNGWPPRRRKTDSTYCRRIRNRNYCKFPTMAPHI